MWTYFFAALTTSSSISSQKLHTKGWWRKLISTILDLRKSFWHATIHSKLARGALLLSQNINFFPPVWRERLEQAETLTVSCIRLMPVTCMGVRLLWPCSVCMCACKLVCICSAVEFSLDFMPSCHEKFSERVFKTKRGWNAASCLCPIRRHEGLFKVSSLA